MFDCKTINKTDNFADIQLITNRPTIRVAAPAEREDDFSNFTL